MAVDIAKFFQDLNYSASNEDSRSELRALRLQSADRVLCITGSGARALDLLIGNPGAVVSVDFNPTQSFLLELKMAAIRALNHQDFLAFLGVLPSARRPSTYQALRSDLSGPAKAWWDAHPDAIKQGIIWAGRWEKYLRMMAKWVHIFRGRKLKRLFAAKDLDEQRAIWEASWDDSFWRGFLRLLSIRWLWKTVFPEPGIDVVPADLDLLAWVRGVFERASRQVLFRESDYAWLMFWGRYDSGAALPLHLQPGHFDTIKAQLHKIEVVTEALNAHLDHAGEAAYDAFSLSDFSSYADTESYVQTWQRVLRAARPGARICERQFVVKYDVERLLAGKISRDTALEQALNREDSAFIYSLIVAQRREDAGSGA